ncbi:hypothetical protein B0H34DRAFT_676339 [Crassisporium funariophilum]|nr:hypothetical protein B0H34DRAFT_676339 [Crassisporium funariophilum]
MLSALVIRSKSKKRPSIFDECVRAQCSSSDIVIYSALATQIVRIAWPLYCGVKIKPSGIKDWLRARGLHWACFCGMTAASGVHLSAQIVHTIAGDVVVFCHYEPSTCNFFHPILTSFFSQPVETCDICKATFLQANFKAHVQGCCSTAHARVDSLGVGAPSTVIDSLSPDMVLQMALECSLTVEQIFDFGKPPPAEALGHHNVSQALAHNALDDPVHWEQRILYDNDALDDPGHSKEERMTSPKTLGGIQTPNKIMVM